MKLAELHPRMVTAAGAGERSGLGITFDCPHCREERLYVPFKNPVDGGPAGMSEPLWERTGDTFETMTLRPSVDASAYGHWHGFITNGEVTTC